MQTNPRFFSSSSKKGILNPKNHQTILTLFLLFSDKGENYELKADLNSEYREKRKETVKKVIANMTLGKDVSSLFPDVVKNMQTEDLELKKLVYLYLINYAKTQPELVILAVNTFVKVGDLDCWNRGSRHLSLIWGLSDLSSAVMYV